MRIFSHKLKRCDFAAALSNADGNIVSASRSLGVSVFRTILAATIIKSVPQSPVVSPVSGRLVEA